MADASSRYCSMHADYVPSPEEIAAREAAESAASAADEAVDEGAPE
jgi:hypothetical protein